MPRWIRLLSCSFTGLLLALIGFFVSAYLYEGNAYFWRSLIDFAATSGFWSLSALFGLLMAGALLLSRLLVRLYPLADGLAGAGAGAALALLYVVFVAAAHAPDWGGWTGVIYKLWPAGFLFALPLALSGAFTAWLWRRLD